MCVSGNRFFVSDITSQLTFESNVLFGHPTLTFFTKHMQPACKKKGRESKPTDTPDCRSEGRHFIGMDLSRSVHCHLHALCFIFLTVTHWFCTEILPVWAWSRFCGLLAYYLSWLYMSDHIDSQDLIIAPTKSRNY